MKIKPISETYYKLLEFILFFPTHISSGIAYYYHFDKNEYKDKPIIVIGDHASHKLVTNMFAGVNFKCVNVIMSYLRGREPLYHFASGISNSSIYMKQISNDPAPVKQMLDVLRQKGSLFLLPEGRFSYDGSTNPVRRSVAKFLKAAGVDVIICNSYGAYLQNPYFNETPRKGKQEYHYRPLFSAGDLKRMSADEIYDELMKRLSYNDYEWNRTVQNSYLSGGRNAEGLENLLYYCPRCGSEFKMKGYGSDFICENCGNTVHLNDKYEFSLPDEKSVMPYLDISEWYADQRRRVRDEVNKPDFSISYECEMWTIDENRKSADFDRQSEGVLVLNSRGMTYTPKKDKSEGLFVPANEILSFYADIEKGVKKNFMFYRDRYVDFRPISEKKRIIKYMLAAEELRNLYHQDWVWEKHTDMEKEVM